MFNLIKIVFQALIAIISTAARVLTKLSFAAEDIVDVLNSNCSTNLDEELEARGKTRTDLDSEFEARLKRSIETFDKRRS